MWLEKLYPLHITANIDDSINNNYMIATSAKLRSCWVIDAGHRPWSRCYYCPHFMPLGPVAHRKSQLSSFSALLQECPSVQVPSLSDDSLHTGLQDAFLPPTQEWKFSLGKKVKQPTKLLKKCNKIIIAHNKVKGNKINVGNCS